MISLKGIFRVDDHSPGRRSGRIGEFSDDELELEISGTRRFLAVVCFRKVECRCNDREL